MKTYKTLLFDVDDTLLDFGAAERMALGLLCSEHGLALDEELHFRYKKINGGLWRAFEEGKLSRDEVVNTRYSLLFKEYGREVDGVAVEAQYRKLLEQGHDEVQGALALITALEPRYDLFIVTNGVSATQHKRLQASGLFPMFRSIFVSEDTGFQKPMKAFFDYVFERIPGFAPGEALIIGDSLSADIKGGQNAGLDTCWFNPEGKPADPGIVPTYEIRELGELYVLLGVDKPF